jgi:non-reducing end alpha-L-arabinofuranosidase
MPWTSRNSTSTYIERMLGSAVGDTLTGVQSNITSAGYSGASNGDAAPAGTITGPGGQCVDVIGDDSGTDLARACASTTRKPESVDVSRR